MASTASDWLEYIKSLLPSKCFNSSYPEAYLQAIKDGEEMGFLAEPTYNKALAMFHTWASEELGITRLEFSGLVSLEKLGGDYLRLTTGEEISIKIDGDQVLLVGRTLDLRRGNERDENAPWVRCPQPEWGEPYEGFLEDLTVFEKEFQEGGSHHLHLWKSAARFDIKHLPAFIDCLILRAKG